MNVNDTCPDTNCDVPASSASASLIGVLVTGASTTATASGAHATPGASSLAVSDSTILKPVKYHTLVNPTMPTSPLPTAAEKLEMWYT